MLILNDSLQLLIRIHICTTINSKYVEKSLQQYVWCWIDSRISKNMFSSRHQARFSTLYIFNFPGETNISPANKRLKNGSYAPPAKRVSVPKMMRKGSTVPQRGEIMQPKKSHIGSESDSEVSENSTVICFGDAFHLTSLI